MIENFELALLTTMSRSPTICTLLLQTKGTNSPSLSDEPGLFRELFDPETNFLCHHRLSLMTAIPIKPIRRNHHFRSSSLSSAVGFLTEATISAMLLGSTFANIWFLLAFIVIDQIKIITRQGVTPVTRDHDPPADKVDEFIPELLWRHELGAPVRRSTVIVKVLE